MFNQTKTLMPSLPLILITAAMFLASTVVAQSQWKTHDITRPRPPVVTPDKNTMPSLPPSDAIILFDGKDLAQWSDAKGEPAKWKVENGYMEISKGGGDIRTKAGFGDVQLHIEWAAPTREQDGGQNQGNSGVYLMGLYEVQVLDSYQSETYADGQAAAIYGQYPPLANACRPPGEWQSYDIIFRRPRFGNDGALLQSARMTVLHNGILVHDNVALWGPTNWMEFDTYTAHADKLPISLQDHGSPVRYRNIWLRELPEPLDLQPPSGRIPEAITLAPEVLDRYAGKYEASPDWQFTLKREGEKMLANFSGERWMQIVPLSESKFTMVKTAGDLDFELDKKGKPKSVVFRMGGGEWAAKKLKSK